MMIHQKIGSQVSLEYCLVSTLPSLEFLPLQLEVISFNALISSCEKGQQWQLALSLLGRMQQDQDVGNCEAGFK